MWPRFVAGERVVGLDAATGQQVWSLADRYARSSVVLVAGNVALVYAHPTELRPGSGRHRHGSTGTGNSTLKAQKVAEWRSPRL